MAAKNSSAKKLSLQGETGNHTDFWNYPQVCVKK